MEGCLHPQIKAGVFMIVAHFIAAPGLQAPPTTHQTSSLGCPIALAGKPMAQAGADARVVIPTFDGDYGLHPTGDPANRLARYTPGLMIQTGILSLTRFMADPILVSQLESSLDAYDAVFFNGSPCS